MQDVGFEPTKLYADDLKSSPFDRSGNPACFRLHLVCYKYSTLYVAVCSLFYGSREARTPDPGLIRPVLYRLSYRTNGTLGGDRTHNLQIRSLTRYPLRYEGKSYLIVYFTILLYDLFHYTI